MSRERMLQETIAGKFKELKMPGASKCFRERARQGRKDGWSHEEFLVELLEEELRSRAASSANNRRREARFPLDRTLDQFDFSLQPELPKDEVLRLSRCEWVAANEPVLLAGPVGTGKTHLAIALGLEATKKRYRVRFYRADDLVRELTEAKTDHDVGVLMRRLDRLHVLILDELGFVPFDRTGAELLFNALVQRYQRRATIVTTNLQFSEWAQVFGDERMTAALLDRLAENAHVITTSGVSHRTRGRFSEDETPLPA